MREVDEYVNLIVKDFSKDNSELITLKTELKDHIVDKIEELKKNGYSEQKSIEIAINEFGNFEELNRGFADFFRTKNKLIVYIILVALIVISTLFFRYLTNNLYDTILRSEFFLLSVSIYFVVFIIKTTISIKKRKTINIKNTLVEMIISIYLLLIISRLIFPLFIDLGSSKDLYIDFKLGTIGFKYYILNSLIYIPLGFFIPIILDNLNSKKRLIIVSIIPIAIHFIGNIIKYSIGMSVYFSISLYLCMFIGGIIGNVLFEHIYKHKVKMLNK